MNDMMNTWLAQWNMSLLPSSDSFRLNLEGRPELLIERRPKGWLLAMTLGAPPEQMLKGIMLLVLQANGPFSSLAPLRLTCDTAGDVVLWVELIDADLQFGILNDSYGKLCEAHALYTPLLQASAPHDDLPVQHQGFV